ncbi:SECY homolog 1 [Prunus dulcis]|uniref:SECY homolog 1 n=1 Tax=Prunus dulcis TaxID=3755 RepID=A0A4Y1QM39_PRUDU|nr:SECY homolog 1 [Prunus dulcis]
MLIMVRGAFSSSPVCFSNPHSHSFSYLTSKASPRLKRSVCKASFSVQRKPNTNSTTSWKLGVLSNRTEAPVFDPLGINSDCNSGLNATWESFLGLLSQKLGSASSSKKEKPTSARGLAAAIEDSSIDFGDFFRGPLPGKFLILLAYLALSRLGIYIPLGGVNREAFVGNLDQNSLLSTLDSFSGGGIGRLGICSLGIVPFINAQIVFQLLAQIYPKLQDLQKREGEAGRKKILWYTQYASVGFAIVQYRVGSLFCYLIDACSVLTTYIGERISDLKLGNGTSLLIFTSIISYFPASVGRTVAQAFQDGNYVGLAAITVSSFCWSLELYMFRKQRGKFHLTMPQDTTAAEVEGFKDLLTYPLSSSWYSSTLHWFSCIEEYCSGFKPRGFSLSPHHILLIAFFNYYYTFLQLDPDDVSEQLKRQGASIPLVRPGKSTAAFLKTVLSRISVLGSAFLAILAAGPSVIEQVTHLTAFRGFAGTSVLILVGCATDTARKVQAEIISQKYKNIEFYNIDKFGP